MARKGTSKSLKRFDVAPEYLNPVSHTAMTAAAHNLLEVEDYKQDIKESKDFDNPDNPSINHWANPDPFEGKPWDMTPFYYEGTSLDDNMRHIPSLEKEAKEYMSGLKLPDYDAVQAAATDDYYNRYHREATGGWRDGKDYYPKRSTNQAYIDQIARWGYNEQDFMTKDQLPKKNVKKKNKSINDPDHNPMDTTSWDDNTHHLITGKWLTKGEAALPSWDYDAGQYTPVYRDFIQHQYDRVQSGQPKTTIEEYVTNHVPNHEALRRDVDKKNAKAASKSKKKANPKPAKAEKPKAPSKPLSKNQFGGDWGAEQLKLF